jgi:hypothetical protein
METKPRIVKYLSCGREQVGSLKIPNGVAFLQLSQRVESHKCDLMAIAVGAHRTSRKDERSEPDASIPRCQASRELTPFPPEP